MPLDVDSCYQTVTMYVMMTPFLLLGIGIYDLLFTVDLLTGSFYSSCSSACVLTVLGWKWFSHYPPPDFTGTLMVVFSFFSFPVSCIAVTQMDEVTRNIGGYNNYICLTILLLCICFLFLISQLKRWQHASCELLAQYAPFFLFCVLVGLYIITTHDEVEEVNEMVTGH